MSLFQSFSSCCGFSISKILPGLTPLADWLPNSARARVILWEYTAEQTLTSHLLGIGVDSTPALSKQLKAAHSVLTSPRTSSTPHHWESRAQYIPAVLVRTWRGTHVSVRSRRSFRCDSNLLPRPRPRNEQAALQMGAVTFIRPPRAGTRRRSARCRFHRDRGRIAPR
jgi:hypothetical protein